MNEVITLFHSIPEPVRNLIFLNWGLSLFFPFVMVLTIGCNRRFKIKVALSMIILGGGVTLVIFTITTVVGMTYAAITEEGLQEFSDRLDRERRSAKLERLELKLSKYREKAQCECCKKHRGVVKECDNCNREICKHCLNTIGRDELCEECFYHIYRDN